MYGRGHDEVCRAAAEEGARKHDEWMQRCREDRAREAKISADRKSVAEQYAHQRQMQQDRFEHETRMAQMQAASQREHLIHQERLRQMELAAHRNIQGRR